MSLFFTNSSYDKQMKSIPIDKILPNPAQPRLKFDEAALRSLADSISRYGVLQPISVRVVGNKYELIAGERRLRAARIAGLSEIPCLLIRAGEKRSAEMAMAENLQRCDLDMFEEAEAIEKLLSQGDCTQATLAGRLSMSQSALNNKLRILRFNAEQRDLIRNYRLSERHARTILRLPPERRTAMLKKVGKEGMSVAATELAVDRILCETLLEKSPKKAAHSIKAPKKTPSEQETAREESQNDCMPNETADAQPFSPCANTPESPIRTVIMRDLTLFYNSLQRSLDLLENAGYHTEWQRREEENGKVHLSIVLGRIEG